jgi:hypothetical protein
VTDTNRPSEPDPKVFEQSVDLDPDLIEHWRQLASLDKLEEIAALEGESGSPHGDAAVALARREAGTVGGAKYQSYFGDAPGTAWCALFVSWAVDMTGNHDHKLPWGNPAYVPAVESWARANGRLVSRPLHGDMFGMAGEHMGLVAGASPDGSSIWTIEGNWSNRVLSQTRRSTGLWFARLAD